MARTKSGGTNLYVGFFSALDYWRGVSNLGDYQDVVEAAGKDRRGIEHYQISYAAINRVRAPVRTARSIRDLGIGLSPDAPLDILVCDTTQMRTMQRLRYHALAGPLPQHSFVQTRDHVFVATPEALFLQLAQLLSIPQLALVGMELCGTYALDGSGEDATGFCQRPRLITRERLLQYLGWCHGRHGLEKARRVARLLMNNSNSPRESATILALTMPNHLRGLGLPEAKLNHRTRVKKWNREGTSQSQYYYDFYWTGTRVRQDGTRLTSRVDGEYDSDSHHSGTLKLYSDARRGNSVQYMGTAHVVITSRDLDNASDLIRVGRQISRHIWHRMPSRAKLAKLEPKLDDLLEELKSGTVYPVSLDSDGRLPKHHRPAS